MASSKILKKAKYLLRFLPDKVYIQLYYTMRFKRPVDFKHPRTFNEKLQWLKLYDRNPLYTTLVDKADVKAYVAEQIGEEYIIPTLGVWDRFDQIDFESLPERFVLKCTHDSEGIVICKDKSKLNLAAAREKLEAAMRYNFYYIGREWPYKNVKPRIIAEQYMEDHVDRELRDYKFFCFNGTPKAMFVATDRDIGETKFDYFDMDFQHLDLIQHYPNAGSVRKPQNFDKMAELSKVLSLGIPHVRVDWYEVDGRLYFGEMTFFHFSGFMPFQPGKWDEIWGQWLDLPKNTHI